jgi:hypothetical protein
MASLVSLNYFLPIISFLFVFILVYALLAKTKILGENNFVHLMISFILAVFFIVNVSLVDFVNFSSAWIIVFLVVVFFMMVLIAFTHGKVDVIMKPWVAWLLVIVLIVVFVISSAYTFNWAVNWERIWDWFYTDWFGFVLLLVVAGAASWVLTKK